MSAEGFDDIAEVVLRLLKAVPHRPERLRVSTGDVTVDLDWRSLTTVGAAVAAPTGPTTLVAAASPGVEQPAPAPTPSHAVCAPAVGTFYHASLPGAAPFVAAGDIVSVGQQVAIIEAMKLMMPVEADRAGRVVEILVADGKPVEYGEPLILLGPVEPDQGA